MAVFIKVKNDNQHNQFQTLVTEGQNTYAISDLNIWLNN